MFEPDTFSTDFELATTDEPQSEPTPEPEGDGPWISHGVVHIAKPPAKH